MPAPAGAELLRPYTKRKALLQRQAITTNDYGRQLRVINLAQLRENTRLIRSAVPASARLMAVVKADAYGHGAVQTARAVLEADADWLAVACVEEGVELREAGIDAPILVLGGSNPRAMAAAARHHITLALYTPEQVAQADEAAREADQPLEAHVKLDTGMGRIGARTPEEVIALREAFAAHPSVRLTGVFTHFADADGVDLSFTHTQLRRFEELTALLPDGLLRHCANSAAIHRLMPEAAFDMVRMGISLYGYPPVATDLPLKPCMRWEAEITHVKDIAPGDAVSYGCIFRAETPMRIATVACGYGDGYHRAATGGATVLIHGQRAPIVGRICMDQMMADVTDIPGVKAGDTAVLLGEDGSETVTAEDIARWSGTISYEVLLAATGRVHREWRES